MKPVSREEKLFNSHARLRTNLDLLSQKLPQKNRLLKTYERVAHCHSGFMY